MLSYTERFAAQFSPMREKRALDTLNRHVRNNGRCVKRWLLIDEKLAKGWRIGEMLRERALIAPDGITYLTESQLSKTALDYAEWLLALPLFGETPACLIPGRYTQATR